MALPPFDPSAIPHFRTFFGKNGQKFITFIFLECSNVTSYLKLLMKTLLALELLCSVSQFDSEDQQSIQPVMETRRLLARKGGIEVKSCER